MFTNLRMRPLFAVLAISLTSFNGLHSAGQAEPKTDALEQRFATTIKPFLERHFLSCHGATKPKAPLVLTVDVSVSAIVKNIHRWEQVLERVETNEMPPENAKTQPTKAERAAVIA